MIEIRKIQANEAVELQNIAKRTFKETFGSENSTENLEQYLENSFTLQKVESEINHPNSAFYFASEDKHIAAYLKINLENAQTEIRTKNTMELERIYVLKKYQGKGIGKLLLQKAIELAKQNKVNFLWLGVWEKNYSAISFYEKYGFVKFDQHIFTLGKEEQVDVMMKLEIGEM